MNIHDIMHAADLARRSAVFGGGGAYSVEVGVPAKMRKYTPGQILTVGPTKIRM